ncbi:putative phage holin [Nocardia farcinica]|uniref:Uncharacterized protein n=1 Tax=Nocardia farcinica (strain IFM 10152) TaxID=247156 RepID=Q5YZJ9_NOCFA|nr:hypothetical protein [Nocardia farcinica]BAD56392.1 hypothetical protein NFA_15470 [Nocardia farcinica IFM 10152]
MSVRVNHIVLAAATLAGGAAYIFVPDREALANALLGVIAVLGWIFVAAYGIRSRWTSTAAGRGVMRLMVCLALICTHGTATLLWGYPGRDFIRPLLLLAIVLAVLDLLATLLRLQRTRSEDG